MKKTLLPHLLAFALAAPALAQSTAITYQGRLKSGTQLASGLYDFQFRLFDAATGGSQIGATQCADNVAVSEGMFTATIDFGQQYATTASRFLEVQARADTGLDCSSAAGFVVVMARQPLVPAPMAAHASAAFALDAPSGLFPNAVFVDNAGEVGIGTTLPASRLHIAGPGEGVRVQGQAVGAANVAWIGFHDLFGIEDAYVGDASSGDSNMYLNSDSGDVLVHAGAIPGEVPPTATLSVKVGGNVGVGTQVPAAKLDVRGDIALGFGQLRAAASTENLRIIRGVINDIPGGGATIAAGSGFAMSSPSLGHYTITFTTPFTATPSVTVTTQGFGDDFFTRTFAMTQSVTSSGVNLQVINRDDGIFVPRPVHFIAIGPR